MEVASPIGAWMEDVTSVSAFSFIPNSDVRFEIQETAGGLLVAGPITVAATPADTPLISGKSGATSSPG